MSDEHIDDLRPDWSEEAIDELIFTASFAAGQGRIEWALGLSARFDVEAVIPRCRGVRLQRHVSRAGQR